MNERLKELAFQAGFVGESMNPIFGTCQETALKNFAELIVRECIQQMDNEYSKAWNTGVEASADKFVNGINKAMKVVKEHFGIE